MGTHQTIINSTATFNDKLNVPGWIYKGNIMGDPHVRMDGKQSLNLRWNILI